MKKLLFICAIALAELSIASSMGARPALAIVLKCGSSWEICNQRKNGISETNNVPRFCFDKATGKFTHWGPCRVVCLPDGRCVKVAR